MPGPQNIPNAGQKTVRANMKVKSFILSVTDALDTKKLKKFEEAINSFLETIDNQKRFLNGRNSYALGDNIHTMVWYLEKIPNEPVATPFGKKDAKPDTNTKTTGNK